MDGKTPSLNQHTRLCVNENHKLFIDKEYFCPVIMTIIEEKRNTELSCRRQGPQSNHICTKWELSDNDLADYWFRYTKVLPASSVKLWDVSYNEIVRLKNVLYGKWWAVRNSKGRTNILQFGAISYYVFGVSLLIFQ